MIKQVICEVCGNYYGIDSRNVISVENGFVNIELENVPEAVEGVIIFRDDLVPIINMRKVFGKTMADVPERTQLIYMNCDDMCMAFRYDRVAEITEVDDTKLQKIPVIVPSGVTAYVGGVIKVSDKLVTVVNHNKLLSKSEMYDLKQAISAFKKREEEARAAEEEARRKAEEEAMAEANESENEQPQFDAFDAGEPIAEVEVENPAESEE